jgi:DNA-directed RNA polymerase subunit beta'
VAPSQDMVLGCYYLTARNPALAETDRYFANLDDAIRAYDRAELNIHSFIWVRYDGLMESDDAELEPLKTIEAEDGTITKLYKYRRVRETSTGEMLSQYIYTTPGRIIYNKTIQEVLSV